MKIYDRQYVHWNILRRKYPKHKLTHLNQMYMDINVYDYTPFYYMAYTYPPSVILPIKTIA